jgi:biopolymer transport protein TolR
MSLLRRPSSRPPLGVLSELNVTPLLDLAFVLLVIFMITAPLLRQGMELNLPTTKEQQDPSIGEHVVALAVQSQGGLMLNGVAVAEGALTDSLRQMILQQPGLAVVLETPQSLPVQRLVELLELVKQSGVARMGIVTRTEEKR